MGRKISGVARGNIICLTGARGGGTLEPEKVYSIADEYFSLKAKVLMTDFIQKEVYSHREIVPVLTVNMKQNCATVHCYL
jgi:hypothetical protein